MEYRAPNIEVKKSRNTCVNSNSSNFISIFDIQCSIFDIQKHTVLPIFTEMSMQELNLVKECSLKATRSGGAGGQHVNKVSSKIELTFDIPNSKLLSDEQKNILLQKLSSKLSLEGVLRITDDSDRSQHENREKCISKFYIILENALKPFKKRKKTKISKAVKEKRLLGKKKKSEKKKLRREKF